MPLLPFSSDLYDVAKGCRDPSFFYWTDFRFPVAAGYLDLDIEAPLTFGDLGAGRAVRDFDLMDGRRAFRFDSPGSDRIVRGPARNPLFENARE